MSIQHLEEKRELANLVRGGNELFIFDAFDVQVDSEAEARQRRALRGANEDGGVDLRVGRGLLLARLGRDELQRTQEARCTAR